MQNSRILDGVLTSEEPRVKSRRQGLSRRAYERFIDAMGELDAERYQRPFQVVIVDNDIPTDIARRMKVVNFTPGNGLIRDLETFKAGGHVQMSIDDPDETE